jgi:hypothetical protein
MTHPISPPETRHLPLKSGLPKSATYTASTRYRRDTEPIPPVLSETFWRVMWDLMALILILATFINLTLLALWLRPE